MVSPVSRKKATVFSSSLGTTLFPSISLADVLEAQACYYGLCVNRLRDYTLGKMEDRTARCFSEGTSISLQGNLTVALSEVILGRSVGV
jgi:hypothetical protein